MTAKILCRSGLVHRSKQIERDIDDYIGRHPSLKRDADLMASILGSAGKGPVQAHR
jgi:hypothetical protein